MISEEKENIIEVHFIYMEQSDIDQRYQNATIKAELTEYEYASGGVYCWLEVDVSDSSKYVMYVASLGIAAFPKDCHWMFRFFDNLHTIEFSNISTARVNSMSGMFNRCSSLYKAKDTYIKVINIGNYIDVLVKYLHFDKDKVIYNEDGSVKDTNNKFTHGDYYIIDDESYDVIINGDVNDDGKLSEGDFMQLAYKIYGEDS